MARITMRKTEDPVAGDLRKEGTVFTLHAMGLALLLQLIRAKKGFFVRGAGLSLVTEMH